MAKMEIHPSKLVSVQLTQTSSSPHEMTGHFHPHFRYNVKQIFHPVLTPPFINHARYSFISHLGLSVEIPLRPEILFGKQTHKQLNLLVCYKSILEIGGMGDK